MLSHEYLENALGYIAKPENWCQHMLTDGNGRYCAAGALNMAAVGAPSCFFGTPFSSEAQAAAEALDKVARAEGFEPTPFKATIAVLNNQGSHADVVAAFQKAIRAEKERHSTPLPMAETARPELLPA